MTTATTTRPASVFDADLPMLDYHDLSDPVEVHARVAAARTLSPIGLGPYGPEVLRYADVHTVLRDPRFINPPGLGLEVQGVTSGPLWERAKSGLLAIDGAAWRRWSHRPPPDWSTPWPRPDPATSSPTSPGPTRLRSSAPYSVPLPRTGTCSRDGLMRS